MFPLNKMSNTNFDYDYLSNNLNSMCRSCLTLDCEFIDIFSKHAIANKNIQTDVYFNEMITDCAQILIKKDDELPHLLCKNCADHAAVAYSFRCQTRESDILLQKIILLQKCSDSVVKDENNILDSKTMIKDEDVLWKNNESISSSSQSNFKMIKLENKSVTNKRKMKKKLINKKPAISRKLKKSSDLKIEKYNKKTQFNESISTENIINEELKKDLSKEVQPEFDLISAATKLDSIDKVNESESDIRQNRFEADDKIEKKLDDNSNNENSYDEIMQSDVQLDMDDEDSSNELTLAKIKTKDKKQTVKKKPSYPPLYSDPDTPQTCSICDTKFPNVSSLVKHRAQLHGPKKYQCLTCGNGLTTTRGLRIHLRLHTGEKPEICVVCGKTFSDPRTLKSHERIHTGQQPFPCTICNKRFPARLSLALHLRSHTGERPYQCQHCDKSYVLANSFKIHMRTHTGVKPYTCKMCDKGFTNKTSLSVHMLTHSGVKNFQCTVCGKRMARSGELTVHLRTHSGERPFACTICQKTFTNSSALRDHTTTHTGVKNYVCTVCGKRMARAMELNVHMRTHTGERRYRCPHCDQRFTTSSNMRLHLRKHTGEKPFACDVCNRKFADSHALKNHTRTHTGEKPYACDTCGNTFTQLGSLNTHLNTHHKATQKPAKKTWNFSKETQIINLGNKSNQHYLTSLDDSSLSKILSSSGGIDQSNIDLQECVPIAMHSDAVQLNNGHQNFTTSLESDSQLLQIIKRPMDGQASLPNMDVWQNCLTITSPQTFKLV